MSRTVLFAALALSSCATCPTPPVESAPTVPVLVVPADGDYAVASGSAGGLVPASAIGASCTAFVTREPSHVVELEALAGALVMGVHGAVDSVLVVRGPDGVVACDDDGGGYPNPLLWLSGAAGRYEVWVGTFAQADSGPYALVVHTADARPGPTTFAAGSIAGVPTECGMTVPAYGPITIGTPVVLGVHTGWTGPDGHGGYVTNDTWWNDSMWAYVGQPTVVTELGGLDPAGCPYVRTAIDGGSWGWRIRNLAPPDATVSLGSIESAARTSAR